MSTQVKLTPPWYTLWNQVKATIGADPSVTVGELQTGSVPYVIPISTSDPNKAQALANIVMPSVHVGVIVNLQVSTAGQPLTPIAPTSAQELGAMVSTALNGNPLLTQVIVNPLVPTGPAIVWPIFTKSVIQFFNDDLSDYYNNYNGVTADVFKIALNLYPGGYYLYPSTANS